MATHSGAPFVGRERELEELYAALDDALHGRGRLVMLVGEPGIGKTRMAEEFAGRATSRGAEVLWGRCHEEPGAPPFWPWLQVMRAYVRAQNAETLRSEMGPGAADIAELVADVRVKLPDLKPPPALENPEAARFRLFDSIATFLGNASKRQPLLLVLDNLHWADKPSLLLLEFVARELGKTRVLVVGTYRDVEVSRKHPLLATLGELTRERLSHRILLRGLSRGDVGRLVELAAGLKPPEGLVDAVNAQTEGNPFFVTEVVRLLAEEGKLTERVSQDALARRTRIPEGVREVVGQRLNRLSEQCNRALTIASVIGREFTLAQLERLSEGQSSEQLLETLEEALSTHMVEESPGAPDEYRFTHALVQQTLAAEISAARRVRLHARIAEVLEGLYGANPQAHAAELAYHFAEAETVLGSEKLVRYSLVAGEGALVSYAFEEALAHFQRGLATKQGKPLDGETAALLFGMGRAQASALRKHELQQAVDSLWRAFDYYVQAGDTTKALALARYPFPPTHGLVRLTQLARDALTLVPPDSLDAGYLLARYGKQVSMETGDFAAAMDAFGRALSIAQRERDEDLELRALADSLTVYLWHGRLREGYDKAQRVLELCQRIEDLEAEGQGRFMAFSYMAEVAGDAEAARLHASASLALAARRRARSSMVSAFYINALLSTYQGDWDAGRRYSDEGLALDPHEFRLLMIRTVLEYTAGDFERGAGYLGRLLEVRRNAADDPFMDAMAAVVAANADTVTGTDEHADFADAAARRAASARGAEPLVPMWANVALALLAIRRGDASEADRLHALLEDCGFHDYRRCWTDRVFGLLARTAGKLDRAAAHFEDGLAFSRKAGYRPELAWACHDYAEMLLARNGPGDRQKAGVLVEEGLATAVALGMRPLVARLEGLDQELASLRRGRPEYPDGLSEREAEVLRLIAQGKTNQQIAETLVISFYTVQRHVSNIFDKTGAANRAEATAYAMRHNLAA